MIFSEPINRKLPRRKAGDKKKRFPIYYEKQNRNCKDVSGIIKDSWCLLLPWRKCQLIRLWCCYQFSESNSFQAHLIMLVITFSFARALRSAVNTYFKINKGIKTSMKYPNFPHKPTNSECAVFLVGQLRSDTSQLHQISLSRRNLPKYKAICSVF